jgi:hypothetical protein
MTQQEIKYFTDSLRRTLYISKILLYEADTLKTCKNTPKKIKGGCKSVENAIHFLLAESMCEVTSKTWDSVRQELSRDELHDISQLLELMADVKNVAEITEILRELKTPIAE